MVKMLENPGNFQNATEVLLEGLENQIENGSLFGQKYISGILVPDDCLTKDMLICVKAEKNSILKARNELKSKNLAFEAILPKKFFKQIIDKKELYSFNHLNEKSETFLNTEKVKDLLKVEKNKKTEIIGLVLFFISLAGTLLLYFVLDKYLYKELDWHWVAIIISNVFILPFIADFLTSDVVSDFGKSIESYFASLLIKPLAVKNYKKFLFPNRCDEYLGSQKKVKIDLISPPDGKDTYSLLTRIKEYVLFNYKTKLYCDENAFEIGNSKNIILSLIGDIDIEERNQREIERQERLRRMRPVDPLITTEIGDYVVLIGAYGTESFINEKEALEEIKDYYKNELSKFQPNLNFKFTNLSLN